MPFVEESAAYFNDFGLAVNIGGVACTGIFDESYAEAFNMIGGSSPALLVLSSVVAAPGNSVTVSGKSFTIASIQPDGTGFKRLMLESA